MAIPSLATNPGQSVSGKVSWFGGPHDSSDSGHTASGVPTSVPGIAVYNRATLGGYWRVTAPNGKTAVLKQTDLGPADWTGRKVDVTYSALGQLGYNEGNFPTDGQVHATYLGHNPNAQQSSLTIAPTQPSVPARTPAGVLNAKNYFLREMGLGNANPLTSSILGTTPTRTPAGTNIVHAGPAQHLAGGPLAGFLPRGAKLSFGRVDQGQDLATNPGGPILAPGSGYVVDVKSDPNGFGPHYPIVHFNSGPLAGKTVYIGHTLATVTPGQRFNAGDVLSHTGTRGVGNATTPGWVEIGMASALGSGNMTAGNQIAPYLRR